MCASAGQIVVIRTFESELLPGQSGRGRKSGDCEMDRGREAERLEFSHIFHLSQFSHKGSDPGPGLRCS